MTTTTALITVDPETLTATVSAATLSTDGLLRLEQEVRQAAAALRREVKRREDYELREEHVAMFRRLRGDTVREAEVGGRALLVGLYYCDSEVWPVALDPATGQSGGVGWHDLDPSPWGPMWLATTARAMTAHRWDGGRAFACGRRSLPLPWDRRRSVFDGRSCRPCSVCARTLTPDFHPSPEVGCAGYVDTKEAP